MAHTPTAHDVLHVEAINLATDTAELLLEFRDRVGSDEAYDIATEVLTLSEQVLQARSSVTTEKSREHFSQARVVCLRAMVALERFAARSRIPLLRSADIHGRLSALSTALGALASPTW